MEKPWPSVPKGQYVHAAAGGHTVLLRSDGGAVAFGWHHLHPPRAFKGEVFLRTLDLPTIESFKS